MSNKHHGEEIHKKEKVPQRRGPSKSPDLLKGSKGNLPPAEVKRMTHKTAKRQAKKSQNQTQT